MSEVKTIEYKTVLDEELNKWVVRSPDYVKGISGHEFIVDMAEQGVEDFKKSLAKLAQKQIVVTEEDVRIYEKLRRQEEKVNE